MCDYGAAVAPARIGARAAFAHCLPLGLSVAEAYPRSMAARYAPSERGCATTSETAMPETDNPFASVLSRPDGETAASPRPSRNRGPGTVTIAGHFSPAVHRQLRLLGVMQDRTVQSLLGEALNELFRKHGKRPIARE